MTKRIDVFRIHDRIMEDYQSFVTSFLTIRDDRIRARVQEEIEGGHFWPDPLIRFNPAYAPGPSFRRTSCVPRPVSDGSL